MGMDAPNTTIHQLQFRRPRVGPPVSFRARMAVAGGLATAARLVAATAGRAAGRRTVALHAWAAAAVPVAVGGLAGWWWGLLISAPVLLALDLALGPPDDGYAANHAQLARTDR